MIIYLDGDGWLLYHKSNFSSNSLQLQKYLNLRALSHMLNTSFSIPSPTRVSIGNGSSYRITLEDY